MHGNDRHNTNILSTTFFLYFADRASQYIYLNINRLDALNIIMRKLRESSLNLCTGRPPLGVMIPEAL